MIKPTLTRKLLDYRWELRGKKVAIINATNNKEIVLDKVRVMSLMKFLPNCLDKMRIEEGKVLRVKLRHSRRKTHEKVELVQARANKKIDKIEARLKRLKAKNSQQELFAKARKLQKEES